MSNLKKTALIAVLGIFGFWLLTKTLNAIASSPGAVSYNKHCASCHGKQGEGIGKLVPPLAQTDWLEENYNQIPCIIANGIKDTLSINGNLYSEEMLAHEHLNEVQIANITNYVLKNFTNQSEFYTEEKIKELLKECK